MYVFITGNKSSEDNLTPNRTKLRLDLPVPVLCVFFVTFISHTMHIISWEQGYYVLNMSPGPWTSARTLTPSAANTVAL